MRDIKEFKDKNIAFITGAGEEEKIYSFEIDYFNKENPGSLYSMLPNKMRTALTSPKCRTCLELSEEAIKVKVKITPTLTRLRLTFWREVERCHKEGDLQGFKVLNVYVGICSQSRFYQIVNDPTRYSYILRVPLKYSTMVEDALMYSTDKLRDMLQLPFYTIDKNGNDVVDTKLLEVFVKVHNILESRVKGAVLQKMEMKTTSASLNVNKNIDEKSGNDKGKASPSFNPESMKDIEAELKYLDTLEKEEKPEDIIDAEVIHETSN